MLCLYFHNKEVCFLLPSNSRWILLRVWNDDFSSWRGRGQGVTRHRPSAATCTDTWVDLVSGYYPSCCCYSPKRTRVTCPLATAILDHALLLCGLLMPPGTRGTKRQRRLLRTCICIRTASLSWITHAHLVPLSVTKRRPVHFILNPGYDEYELGVPMV